MCESSVFIIRDGKRRKVMDSVTLITVDKERVALSDILGEGKTIEGRIVRVDSERHEVYIE